MLRAIGAASVEELYADIPAHLRMTEPLDIPPALRSEAELVRHVEGLLSRNTSTREALSFLGAGCYPHHVPAVCDEVGSRAEFLTAYAGEPYEDHGRFQALFEYASMMGELLEMDVVNVPTYDGFQASATALRMAARITGRTSVVVTSAIGPDELSKIRGYLAPDLTVELVPFDARTGEMDLEPLGTAVGERTAAVLVKTPTYLGVVETRVREIAAIAHDAGALLVASVDPSTLGVLRPPAAWGADIACGDIQPLGCTSSSAAATRGSSRRTMTRGSSWSSLRGCSASRPPASRASTGSATWRTSGRRSPCARRARSGSGRRPPCGGSRPGCTWRSWGLAGWWSSARA
jgi:glycine dehydrogenase subunit 1